MNQHHSLFFGHEQPDRPGKSECRLFLSARISWIKKKGIAAKGKNCGTSQDFNPPVPPFGSF